MVVCTGILQLHFLIPFLPYSLTLCCLCLFPNIPLCLQGTDGEACAWCGKSSFLGSPCVSESTAKYIPPSLSKCKMGKKKKSDADDDDVELAVAK
jgi:hypothetical protein